MFAVDTFMLTHVPPLDGVGLTVVIGSPVAEPRSQQGRFGLYWMFGLSIILVGVPL
jgi:hypothetical protein